MSKTKGKEQLGRETLKRRDFLRWSGFSLGASAFASCSQALPELSLPFLRQSETWTPGEPTFYSTVCGACPAGCGVLGRCYEGRPVKLEGNPDHPLSKGALCAAGQASLLGLYDSHRLTRPLLHQRPADWDTFDRTVVEVLDNCRKSGKKVVILSNSDPSPSKNHVADLFLASFPNAQKVVYDPCSSRSIFEAYAMTHAAAVLPQYRFDRVEVLVAIECDFLGAWLSPVEHGLGYRESRTIEASRLRLASHYQIESLMTPTGAKADYRYAVHPSAVRAATMNLAGQVAKLAGIATPPIPASPDGFSERQAQALAGELWRYRGKCLVVSGSEDRAVQVLCNFMNDWLLNYGRTLDIQFPSYQRAGREPDLAELIRELEADSVGALLIDGANPVYDLPTNCRFSSLLQKVPFSLAFSSHLDETSSQVTAIAAIPHWLETWGDSEPTARVIALRQPLIRRLGTTRSAAESLTRWMGESSSDYELTRRFWQEEVHPRQSGVSDFESFWNDTLLNGFARVQPRRFAVGSISKEFAEFASALIAAPPAPADLVARIAPSHAVGDGRHALNPWLQELPDPLTRVSWANGLTIAPETASRLGIAQGQVVEVEGPDGATCRLPAILQPGQHAGTLGLFLGYGRRGSERFRRLGPEWLGARDRDSDLPIGTRVSDFIGFGEGRFNYLQPVRITSTPMRIDLALAQHHPDTEAGRASEIDGLLDDVVRSIDFETLLATRPEVAEVEPPSLWPEDHPAEGHRWGMAIDLGACTGCGACVIACQAENNIPTVGPDEAVRSRILHWIRIDRYYGTAPGQPGVYFQPMLCQHCGRAPCESVCPVLATVHSAEGLNEQVYNRCIGTRYCANNCPYKVRTFNWFDYSSEGNPERLRLNPEVTVRTRGVMEKCSFCVQRIMRAKLAARFDGTPTIQVQTACQQTCPSKAIIFGDLSDPTGSVAQLQTSPRAYRALEGIGTRPSVRYLAVVLKPPLPVEGADEDA